MEHVRLARPVAERGTANKNKARFTAKGIIAALRRPQILPRLSATGASRDSGPIQPQQIFVPRSGFKASFAVK